MSEWDDDGRSPWERWGWPMRILVILGVTAWFAPAIISIVMIYLK